MLSGHEQTVAQLRELQAALSHYLDKVDVDPARLRELEERLALSPEAQIRCNFD